MWNQFQPKNKLAVAELHRILNWSASGNCCLPLFIPIFILPHSRKNLQNIASAFGGGVVSLISRLHANRVLLHRKNFWHPYGGKKTFQIETEKKVNSTEYFRVCRNLEMVIFKKGLNPFVFLLHFACQMFHCCFQNSKNNFQCFKTSFAKMSKFFPSNHRVTLL